MGLACCTAPVAGDPPLGQSSAPPSGQLLGQSSAPPSGQLLGKSSGPPSGQLSGQSSAPPSGQLSGQSSAPPSGQLLVPPSGQLSASPNLSQRQVSRKAAKKVRKASRKASLAEASPAEGALAEDAIIEDAIRAADSERLLAAASPALRRIQSGDAVILNGLGSAELNGARSSPLVSRGSRRMAHVSGPLSGAAVSPWTPGQGCCGGGSP